MVDTSGASFLQGSAAKADAELELANRCFVFALLSRAFAKEPDEGFCALLASDHVQSVLGMYEGRCSWAREVGRAVVGLQAGGASAPGACADARGLSRLQADYTCLFLGPGTLPAPLWESVYVTGKNEVHTEQTLAVRRTYREHGFSTESFPFTADDHVAVELAFMAALAKSAFDAFERAEGEALERAVEVQGRFLDEHLDRWMEPFAARMLSQKATGPLYPALAAFAAQFCRSARREVRAS